MAGKTKKSLKEAPELLRRCVDDVGRQKGGTAKGDVSKAFAICTAGLQKSGRLKKGSQDLTGKGKEVSAKKYKAPDAKSKHADYEKLLKTARESLEKAHKSLDEAYSEIIGAPMRYAGWSDTGASEPMIGGVKQIVKSFLQVVPEFESYLKRATGAVWKLDRGLLGDEADEITFHFYLAPNGRINADGPCFDVTVDYEPFKDNYNVVVKYVDEKDRVIAKKTLKGVGAETVWHAEKVFGRLMPKLYSEEEEGFSPEDLFTMRVLAGIEGISEKELKIETFYWKNK